MYPRLRQTSWLGFILALALFTGGCIFFGPPHSKYRPIHERTLACDEQSVSAILQTNAGAINLRDDSGRLPLHLAASRNCTDVIAVLIKAGANLEARSDAGETPLVVAAHESSFEAVKMLVDAGAKINVKDKKGYTPLKWATLANENAIADFLRSHGAKE